MKLTKNQIDKLNIELTMNIEPADYAEIEKKKLADCRRRADFKGFRKGNVPMSLVQRVYGGHVLADSITEVIGTGLQRRPTRRSRKRLQSDLRRTTSLRLSGDFLRTSAISM